MIGEKKYMNILHTVASGLHGHSMEMSGIRYTIAFVLVHGGCTLRYPLGLTDCNENKTAEMIKMLKEFQQKYVPFKNEDICESVFFDGDRLRDERIQSSQQAMLNAESPAGRLEGFISKIEDFHTLMNFLEVCLNYLFFTRS